MAKAFAYSGDSGFLAAITPRMREAGYVRVSDCASADIAITFCTTQAELEELYFGSEGFVSMMAPGSLLIDFSAATPNFARELSAVAMVSDLVMVEAPLVVDNMVAEDTFARENISCFVAGEEGGIERARELLDLIFSRVVPTGGFGTAQLARAAYSVQVAAQVIAAIEADALYRAFRRSVTGSGLEDAQAGAITPWAELMMNAVRLGRFEGDYTVEMMLSEMSAALMAADDAELILPQAEAASHLLELLAVIGGADKSPAALSLVYGEEEACAEAGLDWTRAEEAYGGHSCDCDDDDCDCGHHHHGHDDFDEYGFDEFGFDYSAN